MSWRRGQTVKERATGRDGEIQSGRVGRMSENERSFETMYFRSEMGEKVVLRGNIFRNQY